MKLPTGKIQEGEVRSPQGADQVIDFPCDAFHASHSVFPPGVSDEQRPFGHQFASRILDPHFIIVSNGHDRVASQPLLPDGGIGYRPIQSFPRRRWPCTIPGFPGFPWENTTLSYDNKIKPVSPKGAGDARKSICD